MSIDNGEGGKERIVLLASLGLGHCTVALPYYFTKLFRTKVSFPKQAPTPPSLSSDVLHELEKSSVGERNGQSPLPKDRRLKKFEDRLKNRYVKISTGMLLNVEQPHHEKIAGILREEKATMT